MNRLFVSLLSASLAASVMACGKNQIIGERPEEDGGEISADDGEPEVDDDGEPEVDDDGAPDGIEDGGDDTDGDPPPLPDDLPACDGVLNGENSCQVCCVVDGDILEWCEELDCTACQDDGQEIEPGATAARDCNVCTCNRDGTISCTGFDCAVDCDAAPEACSWRTDPAGSVSYDRGDGYGVFDGDLWGVYVRTPDGEVYPTQEQITELYEIVAAPALRDFMRNGEGSCPAIDDYWSQLRSERPTVNSRGSISLSFYPESGAKPITYTRILSADCTVEALQPLSAYLDRLAQ
jgi:hypothetical protein